MAASQADAAPALADPRDLAACALARDGDLTAWADIVHRHAPGLAAYLGGRIRRPDVVNRLVAETVVAAWRRLDGLEDARDLPGWLRRQAAAQAKRWSREHDSEPLEQAWALEDRPAGVAALDQAIAGLEVDQRLAIEYRYRGGLEGEALAAALHLPRERSDALLAAAVATLTGLLPGLTCDGATGSFRPAGLQPADDTP